MASFMSDVRGLNGGGGRSDEARAMLGDMANPHAVAPSGANPSGKSAMDRLNDAAAKITQDAAERNARADFEAQVEEEVAYQEALAAASVKHIQIDDEHPRFRINTRVQGCDGQIIIDRISGAVRFVGVVRASTKVAGEAVLES